MNNQKKTITKTTSSSKVRTVTGIVLAILVAVGIGTTIWYFAAVVLDQSITVDEDFSNSEHLVLKDDVKLNPQAGFAQKNLSIYSNKSSFDRDLSPDKIGYLCPNELKQKISSIEISTANNQTAIDSNSINEPSLDKFVKIKINSQDIDANTSTIQDIDLKNYFVNFDTVAWSDLLRWSSNNPDALFVYNNGTVMPIGQGSSEIQVGICGIVSNKIALTVDEGKPADYTFNNVSNANVGTVQPFFDSTFKKEFTDGLFFSDNLANTSNNFGNVTGDIAYSPSSNQKTFFENIKFLVSFNEGNTWVRIPLIPMQNNIDHFAYDVPQNAQGKKLQYAVIYKYSKDGSGPFMQVYNQRYNFGSNNFGLLEGQGGTSPIYLPVEGNADINVDAPTCIAGQHLKEPIKYFNDYLMGEFFSKNPGITNYQKLYTCVGALGDVPGMPPTQVNSAVVVTMPSHLVLTSIKFVANIATQCEEGQEIVNGECTAPIPPDDGGNVCLDNFVCPIGTTRNGCTEECTSVQGNCPEGQVLVNDKCEAVLNNGNEPALMVNPTVIPRNENREIITWKVGNDSYKNQDLIFTYGTVDPKNIQTDANGFVILENQTTAQTHYDKTKDLYYVVLENLQGGQLSDKNDAGFVNGRKPYYFQVSFGDKSSNSSEFKTLNRFQTILYYYNLVLGDTFELEKYEQPDNSLRAGGPSFFYKPEGQEPLSLKGVQFTLLNDRKFGEFDKRIQATEKKIGNKKTIEMLYRKIHDRIYADNLDKISDPNGVDYWLKQVERDDDNKIDIVGAKFAISVSPESVGNISAMPADEQKKAQANLAYEIVLKRGGDQTGIASLTKLSNAKEMRQKLATSKEYNDRLASIEKSSGRKAAIVELYETLYARAADVGGVNYWDSTEKSIQEIKKEFLNSADFSKVAQ
ncbi:MAG: EB domain-containing protein [Patescibacteria group bacterium]|jgi:hypothetical protein